MKPWFESISTRISLRIALVMLGVVSAASVALYVQIERFLRDDLDTRLRSRLAYSESVIEIDDGKLEFEARQLDGAFNAADRWRLITEDGKVLWESNWIEAEPVTVTLSKSFVIGDPRGSPIPSAALVLVPLDHATENPGHLPPYKFDGPHSRLPVTLSVRESLLPLQQRLRRIALAFWIFGPLAVVGLSALLAALIRQQLAPLSRLSAEAAGLDPRDVGARISTAGSSIELRRLRESLNAMLERLGEQMERERNFASTAAHELRTPLAHLRTVLEIVRRKDREAAEYRRAIDASLGDVMRLQRLIENLLFLARNLEQATIEPGLSLSDVIDQAARDAGVEAGLVPQEGCFVQGQPQLLVSALRNVLENAARYAPHAPPVLNVGREPGRIILSVADSGPGVPDDARELIFERQSRLSSQEDRRARTDGFGLGLMVARAAVRACGGELFCRARGDGRLGAEFVFVLCEGITPELAD